MVLGCAADHCRSADVDVLDALIVGRAAGDCRLERVEIDDKKIDRLDRMLGGRLFMRGVAADRQKPAMHARVKRLDATVHHLGKARQLGDVGDGEARRF